MWRKSRRSFVKWRLLRSRSTLQPMCGAFRRPPSGKDIINLEVQGRAVKQMRPGTLTAPYCSHWTWGSFSPQTSLLLHRSWRTCLVSSKSSERYRMKKLKDGHLFWNWVMNFMNLSLWCSLDWTSFSTNHLEHRGWTDRGFRVNKLKQVQKIKPCFYTIELWVLSYLWNILWNILGRKESRLLFLYVFHFTFPKGS